MCDLDTIELVDASFSWNFAPIEHDTVLSCGFKAVHVTVNEVPWLAFSLSLGKENVIKVL